jgi:flagellar hook-basal body complex protein FliE
MSLKISSIQPIQVPSGIGLPDSSSIGSETGSSFKDVLNSAIGGIEGSRNEANQGVDRFLTGEGDDLHTVILATQRAELEFEMFMQLRNKVVSAYQEIMRIQM